MFDMEWNGSADFELPITDRLRKLGYVEVQKIDTSDDSMYMDMNPGVLQTMYDPINHFAIFVAEYIYGYTFERARIMESCVHMPMSMFARYFGYSILPEVPMRSLLPLELSLAQGMNEVYHLGLPEKSDRMYMDDYDEFWYVSAMDSRKQTEIHSLPQRTMTFYCMSSKREDCRSISVHLPRHEGDRPIVRKNPWTPASILEDRLSRERLAMANS